MFRTYLVVGISSFGLPSCGIWAAKSRISLSTLSVLAGCTSDIGPVKLDVKGNAEPASAANSANNPAISFRASNAFTKMDIFLL